MMTEQEMLRIAREEFGKLGHECIASVDIAKAVADDGCKEVRAVFQLRPGWGIGPEGRDVYYAVTSWGPGSKWVTDEKRARQTFEDVASVVQMQLDAATPPPTKPPAKQAPAEAKPTVTSKVMGALKKKTKRKETK